MLKAKELVALIEKYQAKADKAYRNYQETGISRYDRERRQAEDLADTIRMAASAAEDKESLVSLRAEFISIASRADKTLDDRDPNAQEKLLRDIVAYATAVLHYRR